ncbi:MAG: hypothetical protein GY757_19995, partial [bacterium]|nr:hypothetical protein [bacterium]
MPDFLQCWLRKGFGAAVNPSRMLRCILVTKNVDLTQQRRKLKKDYNIMRKYKFIGFIVILAAVPAMGYLFLLKSIAPEAPGSHTSLKQNYHPDRDIQPYTNLRSTGVYIKNLSQKDLRKYGDTLKYCSFDTATPWPPKNKMPAGFSSEDIIE